jgi:hypothetical protein
MGFLLYHTEGTIEAMRCTLVRRLHVAGPSGVLSAWIAAKGAETVPFDWNLTGKSLVSALAPDVNSAEHTIVMDMMPEKLVGASLCHVTSIAGRSEADESDIVISMRELYMAQSPVSGMDPRLAFVCDLTAERPQLIESMGINGGTKRGAYRWCAPKMNIGAAVFGGARK